MAILRTAATMAAGILLFSVLLVVAAAVSIHDKLRGR